MTPGFPTITYTLCERTTRNIGPKVRCFYSLSTADLRTIVHTIQYNTIQWKICTQKLTNTLSV